MCVICKLEAGAKFDPKFVWVYAKENPHGFGFMWCEKGRVKTYNSMSDADKAEEYFKKFLDANIDFAFHCRLASVGDKNLENTHPIKILSIDDGDDRDVYMMHNGTFSAVGGEKNMSDTYNLATFYLAPLFRKFPGIYLDDDFYDLLDVLVGHNKLVLLDSMGNWVIVNSALGQYYEDDEKVWISNKNKPTTTYTEKYTYKGQPNFPYAASPANKQLPANASGSSTVHSSPTAAYEPNKKDGNDKVPGYWKLDKDGRSYFDRIQIGDTDDEPWSDRDINEILAEVKEFVSEDQYFDLCMDHPYEAVDCMYAIAKSDPEEFHVTAAKNKQELLLWAMSDAIQFADHLGNMVVFSDAEGD